MPIKALRIPHLIMDVYLDSHQGLVVPWTVFFVSTKYNMKKKLLLLLQGSFVKVWQIGQHSFLCIYSM